VLLLSAAALLGGCRGRGGAASTVTINGHTWRGELAVNERERYRGLSGRTALEPNAGMLFIFPRPEVLEFCMRGCEVPLDVAFISSGLEVVEVRRMAVEPDRVGRETYSSQVPAQYALEVAAGALAGAGVKVGDRVKFSPDIAAHAKGGPRP
jgi:hypothetical protein